MSAGSAARRGVTDPGARLRLVAVAATAVFAATALSACASDTQEGNGLAIMETDDDGFNGTLVADPPLQVAPVTLRDTDGLPVRLGDFAPGEVTALFFGFTNCDDICPTTMADLAAAQRTLPSDLAARVALVFVTVDPERDQPKVLRSWLDQFDPDIVGLRGPISQVHRAERSLYSDESEKVFPAPNASSSPPDDDEDTQPGHQHDWAGGYEMNHSGLVYLFGPDGRTVLYTGGATPSAYAEDMTQLLGRP